MPKRAARSGDINCSGIGVVAFIVDPHADVDRLVLALVLAKAVGLQLVVFISVAVSNVLFDFECLDSRDYLGITVTVDCAVSLRSTLDICCAVELSSVVSLNSSILDINRLCDCRGVAEQL